MNGLFFSLSAVLFFLGIASLQAQQTDTSVVTDSSVRQTVPARKDAPEKRAVTAPALPTDGSGEPFDPFNFENGVNGVLTPVQNQPAIPGFEVKGTLTTKDGETGALIKMSGSEKCFFVKVGSQITLPIKDNNNTLLKVKAIREYEVEMVPLQSPDKTIIIR